MNKDETNKDKLILESLHWIICNISSHTHSQIKEKGELLGRLYDELNPREN